MRTALEKTVKTLFKSRSVSKNLDVEFSKDWICSVWFLLQAVAESMSAPELSLSSPTPPARGLLPEYFYELQLHDC